MLEMNVDENDGTQKRGAFTLESVRALANRLCSVSKPCSCCFGEPRLCLKHCPCSRKPSETDWPDDLKMGSVPVVWWVAMGRAHLGKRRVPSCEIVRRRVGESVQPVGAGRPGDAARTTLQHTDGDWMARKWSEHSGQAPCQPAHGRCGSQPFVYHQCKSHAATAFSEVRHSG